MRDIESALSYADAAHGALSASMTKREAAADTVLEPTLRRYRAYLGAHPEETLTNLTRHLLDARDETSGAIRARMTRKWTEASGQINHSAVEKSVTNSLRRSAGTNFQALVSLALSIAFRQARSTWYVAHPVPKAFCESLAIRFDSGLAMNDAEPENAVESIRVVPDLDVLVRNAAWSEVSARPEPIMVLSVKTSIADRGGMAARWKNYFDLVTRPCELRHKPECAWQRLGISLEARHLGYDITHGIVVANIYKIESDEAFTNFGELHSGQARANTFMFDPRITTRTDDPAAVPSGWQPLSVVLAWSRSTSVKFDLPP